jgi:hypothetical protein
MYQARVKVILKDGHFDEVSTSWNLFALAKGWIEDRVTFYSALNDVEKIETALEVK